jgi:quercetin dioxygenase-like cupin family protein
MLKKLFCALLLLGWVPTLAIVVSTKWLAGVPLFAQGRVPIKVTRLYTGQDGKSKVEEFEIPLKARDRGTDLSASMAVTNLQFRRTNQDYFVDWHPAPRRQFIVTLSGESEVELEDGKKVRLGPGTILLAEDTTGKGHISRAVGSKDRLSLIIPLADGAQAPR